MRWLLFVNLTKLYTFASMKRKYIWLVCMVMGFSFLVLLYLQSRYANAIVRMRKEQFDENVLRSLNQASRDLERSETFRYMQDVFHQHEQDTLNVSGMTPVKRISTADTLTAGHRPKMQLVGRNMFPSLLGFNQVNRMAQTMSHLRKQVQNAYVHEREVLEEVIYAVMYTASDERLQDRINKAELDNCLRMALERNGITLTFHYIVYTADGREVFRCEDFDKKGQEYSYNQTLFRSDPTGQMGVVCVHFPDQKRFILGAARYVAPAMCFTLVLFFTFVITVYFIVRQKKVNEMKNDFVHNMTHEFKTPISTISIAAQMLSDKSISKNEDTYERLGGVIYNETRRLRYQLEKVLQMSLFDHNNIALKLQEQDLNELIGNVVQTFSLKVTKNGGSLETKTNAYNPFANVDEMHFTNVIFNLLDNAVKYSKEDVPLHLEVSTWNQGEDNICICVSDNGIGIQKDDLKHIFDRFYRVHTGDKHNVKGFGLGLAYVHKMVQLHHGSIKVMSEIGVGTKFVITLPIIKY